MEAPLNTSSPEQIEAAKQLIRGSGLPGEDINLLLNDGHTQNMFLENFETPGGESLNPNDFITERLKVLRAKKEGTFTQNIPDPTENPHSLGSNLDNTDNALNPEVRP